MKEAEEADCSVFTNRIAGFHVSHVGVHHNVANHILETCLCRRRTNTEVSGFKAPNKQPAASALVFQEEKTETLLKITLKACEACRLMEIAGINLSLLPIINRLFQIIRRQKTKTSVTTFTLSFSPRFTCRVTFSTKLNIFHEFYFQRVFILFDFLSHLIWFCAILSSVL